MKIRIIHHSADWDGKLSGAIAHHWLADYHQEIVMVPWDFGDKPVAPPDDTRVDYILDLPVDKVYGVKFTNGFVEWPDGKGQPIDRWDTSNIIWIDHHKSSIETHPKNIPGYRIDGVAACRLAWAYFTHPDSPFNKEPAK